MEVGLAKFGSEAKPIRNHMKMMASQAYETFWHAMTSIPGAESVGAAYMPNLKSLASAVPWPILIVIDLWALLLYPDSLRTRIRLLRISSAAILVIA